MSAGSAEEAPREGRRLKALIAYDGTDFVGWETQDNGPTIQAAIEQALAQIAREPVPIFGSGRTDAGVHALGQVASFDFKKPMPLRKLRLALNALTPDSIAIRAIEEVEPSFHARFSAIWKRYRYSIVNEPVQRPLDRHRLHHCPVPLDLRAMQETARRLVGTHDFRPFAKEAWRRPNCVRTVLQFSVISDAGLIHLDVTGTGFLYNMVRIFAGTLMEAGLKRREPESVDELLQVGTRARAGFTAPAKGLSLMEVGYPVHLKVLARCGAREDDGMIHPEGIC